MVANVFATKSFLSGFQLSFMLAIAATLDRAAGRSAGRLRPQPQQRERQKAVKKLLLVPDDYSRHRRRLFVISVHRSEAEGAGHAGLADRSLPCRLCRMSSALSAQPWNNSISRLRMAWTLRRGKAQAFFKVVCRIFLRALSRRLCWRSSIPSTTFRFPCF